MVKDTIVHGRSVKFQVKLHPMLFHLIQAIFNFGPKFYIFQCSQSMNTVYAGMVYQQLRTRILYMGFRKESRVQYVTYPKDSRAHCAR